MCLRISYGAAFNCNDWWDIVPFFFSIINGYVLLLADDEVFPKLNVVVYARKSFSDILSDNAVERCENICISIFAL